MDDKRFDDIIRKKLESLQSDYIPETWDTLESRMSADTSLTNDQFDSLIKNKMSDLNSEFDPSSWDDLAAKMELENLKNDLVEDQFDKTIQTKLESFSVPLTDDSWNVLKEKMEQAAYLRTKVYIAKATEVFILFLLLFTIFRLLPEKLNKNVEPIDSIASTDIINAEKEVTEASVVHPDLNITNDIAEKDRQDNELSVQSNSTQQLLSISEGLSENSEINLSATSGSLNETRLVLTSLDFLQNIGSLVESTTIETQLNQLQHKVLDGIQSTEGIRASDRVESSVIMAALETQQGTGLVADFDDLSRIVISQPEDHKRTKVWLNGFVSGDAMLINTPYDPVYQLPAFNKAAAGFSGGASISVQKGSIELDAGFSYASKGYQPQIIRELNGTLEANYVERSLTNIIFDMAQANFSVKHHFLKNKKLQLYALAGSTFNLITYSEYSFEEKRRGGNGTPLLTPVQNQLLDNKKFEKGALEGGSIISNGYFTLNAGFGLQHNLSPTTALYFQPMYQRHILDGGIGPNNDRIHNLTFQLGAKFRIN